MCPKVLSFQRTGSGKAGIRKLPGLQCSCSFPVCPVFVSCDSRPVQDLHKPTLSHSPSQCRSAVEPSQLNPSLRSQPVTLKHKQCTPPSSHCALLTKLAARMPPKKQRPVYPVKVQAWGGKRAAQPTPPASARPRSTGCALANAPPPTSPSVAPAHWHAGPAACARGRGRRAAPSSDTRPSAPERACAAPRAPPARARREDSDGHEPLAPHPAVTSTAEPAIKKRKDPNAPKRALGAYMYFVLVRPPPQPAAPPQLPSSTAMPPPPSLALTWRASATSHAPFHPAARRRTVSA